LGWARVKLLRPIDSASIERVRSTLFDLRLSVRMSNTKSPET
jgi:hypothetical protein